MRALGLGLGLSIKTPAATANPELLPNSDFASGTSGWTAGPSTTLSASGGKITAEKVVFGGDGNWPTAITTAPIPLVAGATYRLAWTGLVMNGVVNFQFCLGPTPGNSDARAMNLGGSTTDGFSDFTVAASDDLYLTIAGGWVGSNPALYTLDALSLQRVG